jgi:hypothetical protein
VSIKHRMRMRTFDLGGPDPVWTIEVEGSHDVYRLATAMTYAQVEFCAVGRSALARLKRHVGKGRYGSLERYLHCRTPEEQAAIEAGLPEPTVAVPVRLLEALVARVRHDHAYPMDVGPHACQADALEDDLRALCEAEGIPVPNRD